MIKRFKRAFYVSFVLFGGCAGHQWIPGDRPAQAQPLAPSVETQAMPEAVEGSTVVPYAGDASPPPAGPPACRPGATGYLASDLTVPAERRRYFLWTDHGLCRPTGGS